MDRSKDSKNLVGPQVESGGTAAGGQELSAEAVAAYLRPKLGENDYLYVADYHPILYYLLPVRAPTRFLFPPFLVDEHWSTVTGVDREQEVRAIFLKRPRYVVKSGEHATPFYRLVREELDRSYRLEHTIGSVEIYRRRD